MLGTLVYSVVVGLALLVAGTLTAALGFWIATSPLLGREYRA